jgi:hypothetical protein
VDHLLVDVLLLRRDGARVRRDELRAATPVRGTLQLGPELPSPFRRRREPPRFAGLIRPGAVDWALPVLHEAIVTRIRGSQMVIASMEEIERHHRVDRFRQAWLVRVLDAELADDTGERALVATSEHVSR